MYTKNINYIDLLTLNPHYIKLSYYKMTHSAKKVDYYKNRKLVFKSQANFTSENIAVLSQDKNLILAQS